MGGGPHWKIKWVANNQPQWLAHLIERHAPVFEHYLKTGQEMRPQG
jgi:hypothetical protein